MAEVSMGPKVPCTKIKVFSFVSRGHLPSLQAPSTFLLLCPYAPKLAPTARYCSRSFKRALDEVMAAGFLIRMVERLFSDRDQLNPFCAKFHDPGNCEVGLQKVEKGQGNALKAKRNDP